MFRFGVLFSLITGPVSAGGLEVSMADGDPHDRIWLRNLGECEIVAGALVLDFAASEGKIIIDTAYGGIGTKDPMPVEVEKGNVTIAPVADGDTQITLLMGGIAPKDQAIVTLDFDNNDSGWFARRVSILGDDVVGAVARFETPEGVTTGTFESGPFLKIELPEDACDMEQGGPVTAPIS